MLHSELAAKQNIKFFLVGLDEGVNLEPMPGDNSIVTAYRTRGVKYFNASAGSDIESGNDCSCGKPSEEADCEKPYICYP